MQEASEKRNNDLAPIKVIAIDLDGTLLSSKGHISSGNRDALRLLAQMGLRIILASGRMSARIRPFGEELGIPFALVSYNGAQVLECDNGIWRTTFSRCISHESFQQVVGLCRDENLFLNIYAGNALYAYQSKGDFTFCDLYHHQTRSDYADRLTDVDRLPAGEVIKLLIIDTPENRDRLYNRLCGLFSSHCRMVKSNPEYLEFLATGVSKSLALQVWLDTHGFTKESLIAFGDAENDLEMLQFARVGIATANATPGLKAHFPNVSRWTNDEDCVRRELELLFPDLLHKSL